MISENCKYLWNMIIRESIIVGRQLSDVKGYSRRCLKIFRPHLEGRVFEGGDYSRAGYYSSIYGMPQIIKNKYVTLVYP